ncbi:MAG: ribonuclease III [Candidatus Harrisonbacteria bacterium CG10_big_fil_rev_8_21_14_0_10_40_38]|uniref:Ribonuclease 3 n=1 Tax=Candidatus Harrisonbacteria bacterium CG10_big_fil_rev_8_21_14_0_10_40_38 TaxID=1974583 RepID=A0A2H0UT25_9BACT|nr:MAG: ribonuclease III [Candidatus Harrisonbacteria bacterium CG10_big_fil_rev_8_21_14_0_10_40_38]
MQKNISELERIISYTFKDPNLIKESLTHRSYLNEDPKWPVSHNERLEFLGDAVVELIVTEELFFRFPDYTEGQLTPIRSALVNYQMMASISREISLEQFLFLSKGESKDIGRAREVILANTLESLIGAIYLDGGYQTAKSFILKFILSKLDEVMKKGLYKDTKSLLQEIVQEKFKLTPTYKVLAESGLDHQKTFTIGVFFGDKLIAEGVGYSKQEAEVEAAKLALDSMQSGNVE